jgi:hypothetical protein
MARKRLGDEPLSGAARVARHKQNFASLMARLAALEDLALDLVARQDRIEKNAFMTTRAASIVTGRSSGTRDARDPSN